MERNRAGWILASGRPTSSHSLLSDTPVTLGTLGAVSVDRSAVNVAMLLCTWLTRTFVFMLPRPCQKRKLACNSKLGGLGQGEGSSVDAKRPMGVYQPRGLLA